MKGLKYEDPSSFKNHPSMVYLTRELKYRIVAGTASAHN